MQYDRISVPADGTAITISRDHSLNVPDNPIIPFIKQRPQDKQRVVSELEQLIPGATPVGTREFGAAVIRHLDD